MISTLKWIVIVLLLAIGTTAGWVYFQVQKLPQTTLPIQETTLLTVTPGMNATAFARELANRGWVDDAEWIRLLYKLQPELTAIKAGEYELEPGLTLGQLYQQVNQGDSLQHRLTVVEGTTVKELLAVIAQDDRLTHELTATNAQELALELGLEFPPGASKAERWSEGLFLAETYQFERGMSDRDLLLKAHALLLERLDEAWSERQTDLPLNSAYEALILASIIEKETGLASERPEISGVFIRRLNKGMRLQTDPTVIYGMGDKYTGNITRKDLRTPTAYNTYTISGLPPTPIASVGPDAITAAVNPKEGSYLYFVAKGDGSHQFSNTLEEHNRAVREYQLQRRSDYRSSPGAGQ